MICKLNRNISHMSSIRIVIHTVANVQFSSMNWTFDENIQIHSFEKGKICILIQIQLVNKYWVLPQCVIFTFWLISNSICIWLETCHISSSVSSQLAQKSFPNKLIPQFWVLIDHLHQLGKSLIIISLNSFVSSAVWTIEESSNVSRTPNHFPLMQRQKLSFPQPAS